jgi:5,10-methylenetetrahydromethanopterin reductase
LTIQLDRDIRECADLAAAADRAGFDDVWLPDHYFLRETYAALALMAVKTSRIRLGTAVVSAVLRHPALIASATATIDEISDGRAVLGIGPGGHEFAANLGHPITRPLTVTREAIEVVRALLRGQTSFAGREFEVTRAQLNWHTRDIPVYIAARGPKTLELAGAVADGVITHGLAASHMKFVRERIQAGAELAGRDPRECEVCLMFEAELDEDVERAVERLRPRSVIIAGGSYSEDLIPIYGLDPDEVAPLRAAVAAGNLDQAPSLVTPRIVNAFSFAGSEAHFLERLRDFEAEGVDRVIVDVGSRSGPIHSVIERAERLGDVLAGRR